MYLFQAKNIFYLASKLRDYVMLYFWFRYITENKECNHSILKTTSKTQILKTLLHITVKIAFVTINCHVILFLMS